VVPEGVRLAFYIGGAALALSVLWTVLSTREYSPAQLRAFDAGAAGHAAPESPQPVRGSLPAAMRWGAAGLAVLAACQLLQLDAGLKLLGACLIGVGVVHLAQALLAARGRAQNPLGETLADLERMPLEMRRLAAIQFFSWCGLFVLWIYSTPVVAQHQFGATLPGSAEYNRAGDWVGVLFAVYNAVAALYAFALPALAAKIGRHQLHALNLLAGAAGLASFYFVRDPQWLILAMVGVGMAWASVLTIPYALLCGALPYSKLGTYMGLFNFFIVIPQLVVSGVMGSVVRSFWPGDPAGVMTLAGGCLAVAALLSFARRPA
jgi:maltose/moltooligosaccharide transporter